MGKIVLETFIQAPPERCFDLSRCVDLHIKSAIGTDEIAIAGVTKGLMGDQDFVTWQARHFGINQKISVKIVKFDRPKHFRDSQTKGIFSHFDHDHFFEPTINGTLMKDVFVFKCPFGILGWTTDYFVGLHLKSFLQARNEIIKMVAESDEWQSFM